MMFFCVIFMNFFSHVTYNFRFLYSIAFIWRYDCEPELPKSIHGRDSAAFCICPLYLTFPMMALRIAVVTHVHVP